MKVKVALETMSDVCQFVNIATSVSEPVLLVGEDLKVSAKSLLGALYTMEWAEVWLRADMAKRSLWCTPQCGQSLMQRIQSS